MSQTVALLGALLVVLLLNAAMVLYFARSERAVDGVEPRSAEQSQSDDDRSSASSREQPGLLMVDRPTTGDGRPSDGDRSGSSVPASSAPPLESDGPTTDCRTCGTTNEQGYQFCRWCVSALGRDDGAVQSGANATGRTF